MDEALVMNGIEEVIERIKAETIAECEEIAQKTAEECARVKAEYAKTEQDEYWRFLGAGAKDTEKRLEQLKELAEQEAKKQLLATQQEMAEAAFELAIEKLQALPETEYLSLLKKTGLKSNISPAALVEKYKETLFPSVFTDLFD